MNGRFDKLAPGRAAKVAMFIDMVAALVVVSGVTLALQLPFNASWAVLGAVGLASWFFASAMSRLYSPCTARSTADHIVLSLMAAGGLVTAVLITNEFAPYPGALLIALTFGGAFAVSSCIFRVLIFRHLQDIDDPLDDVLIVGTDPLGIATFERMRANTGEKRRVIGFVAFAGQPKTLRRHIEVPVLGEAKDIRSILLDHPVEEVYVAGRVMQQGEEMQQIVTLCERIGMPFAVPLHSLSFDRARLLSSSKATDGYLHYLSMQPRPLDYALKRLVDIVASAIGLLLLSPLLATVSVIIKLSSPGPVLFRQKRVGLHGAEFNLLKFRSMVVDAEALKAKLMAQNEQSGPVFKMTHDPRVTRIGRFIRKFSIDELPQLVNILRGDMSIVGPRPALASEVEQYKLWQRRRLSVRPGLTCYWQVSGRNNIGFEEWMRLDLQYIDDWSLRTDIRLILQTFPVVLAGRGAS